MIHSLRAIVWLRWRLLAGSLRGARRRDTMEQVSRIFALMMPAMLGALFFGTVLAVSVLGFIAGRTVGTGLMPHDEVLFIVRVSLFVAFVLLAIVAVASPGQTSLSRYSRLLIMPISRQTLHTVEVVATLSDPWHVVLIPALVCFAVGLAWGGVWAGAMVAAVGAVLFLTVLAALAALMASLVGWLMRSRRRSEMFTLVFVLATTLVAFLPAALTSPDSRRRATATERTTERTTERAQAAASSPAPVPARAPEGPASNRFDQIVPAWTRPFPSELYGRAVLAAIEGRLPSAAAGLAGLAVEAFLLFGLSSMAHARVLGALEGTPSRRRAMRGGGRAQAALPFVSPEVSAIAMVQWRTAVRSVRGRLALFLPGPLTGVMTLMFRSVPEEGEWTMVAASHGEYMFGAGLIFAIFSIQPFTMNLFATDRGGLTRSFVEPLTEVQLTRGKILGAALLFAASAAVCFIVSIATSPGGSPWIWMTIALGGASTFLALAPIYVWLSALFPVAADLSKTGSGGNPHPLPMLGGTVLTIVAAAPTLLLLLVGPAMAWSPPIIFLAACVWLLVIGAVSLVMITAAAVSVDVRRENLAMVVRG